MNRREILKKMYDLSSEWLTAPDAPDLDVDTEFKYARGVTRIMDSVEHEVVSDMLFSVDDPAVFFELLGKVLDTRLDSLAERVGRVLSIKIYDMLLRSGFDQNHILIPHSIVVTKDQSLEFKSLWRKDNSEVYQLDWYLRIPNYVGRKSNISSSYNKYREIKHPSQDDFKPRINQDMIDLVVDSTLPAQIQKTLNEIEQGKICVPDKTKKAGDV